MEQQDFECKEMISSLLTVIKKLEKVLSDVGEEYEVEWKYSDRDSDDPLRFEKEAFGPPDGVIAYQNFKESRKEYDKIIENAEQLLRFQS